MNTSSFVQQLWERKVPQYLGTYLAVGFGLLQFIEFISRRFSLSEFWVDGYLLLWLVLLPAVALIIYYQGLPPAGTGKGPNWKRGLLYLNVLVALLLLVFLPRPSAAPLTEEISTTDADGVTTKRIIPAASTVQRIGLFQFTNEKEDADTDWWGIAYTLVLRDHLHQRPELIVSGAPTLNRYYDKFEAKPYSRINLATQRKIAERSSKDYFVRAAYQVSEQGHSVQGAMYRTQDGKEVQKLSAGGVDFFAVVDQLKEQISKPLPPPVMVDRSITNLPASALITDNEAALEAYTKGAQYFSLSPGDLPPSANFFRASLVEDPSCAPCMYELADKLFGMGKIDSSSMLIARATRLAEVLPEREQFSYKAKLFMVNKDYDNYVRLLESYRQVYPYEYYPYAALLGYYETTYGVDSAIALMETAVAVSDQEVALKQLYGLYLKRQDYDSAEGTIQDLDERYSSRQETQRRYADFYKATGQLDLARKTLQDMIATDPLNYDLPLQLAALETTTGNYAAGLEIAKTVIRKATTLTDSTSAWNTMIGAYYGLGQVRKALQELEAYEKHIARVSPINVVYGQNLTTKMGYCLAVEETTALMEPYFQQFSYYDAKLTELYRCYLTLFAVQRGIDLDAGYASLEDCEDDFEPMQSSLGRIVDFTKLIKQKAYGEVIASLEEDARLKEVLTTYVEANVYRLANQPEAALKVLDEGIKTEPQNPMLLLEKVKTLRALDQEEAASKLILDVLKTWRAADPDHRWNNEAKEIAAELGVEVSS